MKKVRKSTSIKKTGKSNTPKYLPEKYVKTRIEIVDKSGDIAHPFNNQRLLNQFKRLLKSNNVPYIFHKSHNTIILDQYHLVIKASNEGRFVAWSKLSMRGNISFTFEARNNMEVIHKLVRFKLLGGGLAKKITTWDTPIENKLRGKVK